MFGTYTALFDRFGTRLFAGVSRSSIFGIGMFLVGASLPAQSGEEASSATPPNIVFILADDMGINTPGIYGGKVIETPNIDRLAKDGMRFTQAYSSSSLCAPARASLLTGLHSGHTSVRGNTGGIALKDADITFAEVLKARGYTIAGFGKWGVGDLGTEGVPERQGFDRFFGYYHQIHAHFFYPDYLIDTGRRIALDQAANKQYAPDVTLAAMKDFIRDNKDRPFVVFGSWTLPHTNDDDEPVIPEADPALLAYAAVDLPEDARRFAAMNTRLDSDIGEIVNLLEDLEIGDNTVVVFASDNGPGTTFEPYFDTNGSYRGNKRSFYEGGIRVPLIVKWPGRVDPGSVSDLQVYFPDLMPTFADLASAQEHVPEGIDGISFVPTLVGDANQPKHDFLYWEVPDYDWSKNIYREDGLHQAIRQGDWKMLRHGQTEKWELFNLATDPWETTDVASEFPDIVAKLEALIDASHDPMPEQIEPEMPEGQWFR
ncbi:MAG: arylsulfatase [Alphaproteobacteria bacterium]|nr:arylsulfatase [Alphaproteobacteria bacterium]